MIPALSNQTIAQRVRSTDGFRNFSHVDTQYKEWMHFCVFAHDINVLVNFSLVKERGELTPRLTLLVEQSGRWVGDIVSAESAVIRPANLNFSARNCSLNFENGIFHITGVIPEKEIAVNFTLTPIVSPIQTPSVNAGSGKLRWLCIPRCDAEGNVTVGNITHQFKNAPGYHDHNWGSFEWGGNFSWRWGYFSFGSDLSVIVSRILDKQAHQVISDSFMVSSDNDLKDFRGHNVKHKQKGVLQLESNLTVPPIISLAIRSGNVSINREYEVKATNQEDALTLTFVPQSLATIGMPSGEQGIETSTISELSCTANLTGTLRGKAISCTGKGIWEATSRG